MNVKQKLSILFYLKRKRANKDGMIPLYIRVTIDGLEDEISVSCKVRAEHWDKNLKQVLPGEPAWKEINKRISQAKTDIERHFYLMQAKHGLVTPAIVKESYQTPISGQLIRNEKVENMQLSESVDQVIGDYLAYCEKPPGKGLERSVGQYFPHLPGSPFPAKGNSFIPGTVEKSVD